MLDMKLSQISLARLVSRLSSNELGTRLVFVRLGPRDPARLGYSGPAGFDSIRKPRDSYDNVWSDAILPILPTPEQFLPACTYLEVWQKVSSANGRLSYESTYIKKDEQKKWR